MARSSGMRVGGRCGLLVVAVLATAGLVVVAWFGSASASVGGHLAAAGLRSAAAGGGWGKAEEVRGLAALNAGGEAQVNAVSCWSAGNCSAAGGYQDASGDSQVFVVTERKGRWGTAVEVPGMASLNEEGIARVYSLSCAPAGGCSAGGEYAAAIGGELAWLVTEKNGRWGTAEDVPGLAALNSGGPARLVSVSCTSGGNCSAGGFYSAGINQEAFVVTQKNGRWGTAEEVPGTGALNGGGSAQVSTVSCAFAGDCSAGGYYERSGGLEAFVVTQKHGRWGKAEEVPGTAALNKGGIAQIESVSCGSAGNCSAGGTYYRGGSTQVFVVTQKNGRWGKAEEVPGMAALNKHEFALAQLRSVSCASAGNCSAGGYYDQRGSRPFQAFVVTQKNGRWGKAEEVPGTAALNTGGSAQVTSVSCASAGNCTAGGFYKAGAGRFLAFVVTETTGRWGQAQQLPGLAAINAGGGAGVASVSCVSARHCAAGGAYADRNDHGQAFVVSQT
jgi:hypothetical protein